MKFSITYRRTQSITATYPANDLLALHAINSFGFVLNDAATWDRSLSGPQFAEVIATVFDGAQPQVAAVLAHLRSLGAADEPDPWDRHKVHQDLHIADVIKMAEAESAELRSLRDELQTLLNRWKRFNRGIDVYTARDAVAKWLGSDVGDKAVRSRLDKSRDDIAPTVTWLIVFGESPKALRLLELLRAEENRTRANG